MTIKGFIVLCSLVAFFAVPAHGSEKIKIAGSGGMIPLVTQLAKAFMAEKRDVLLLVNQESIQSGGGIKGVVSGELGIGMANRPLQEEEKALGVEVVDIARVAIVVGVNRHISLDGISSDTLCRIYDGKITTWQELNAGSGPITALTKPDSDATKELIRKSISCFKGLKESEKVLIMKSTVNMTEALSMSKAIGFTDAVSIDASKGAVKALMLDGTAPNAESIKSGEYKLVQTFRLVTKGKPSGLIKEFITFVKGPKGNKIIESAFALPVK